MPMNICKNCNTLFSDDAVFCIKCGTKIENQKEPEPLRIPQAMTVAEAAKVFFQGCVSQGLIYAAVREHRIPHVRMSSGKVLHDLAELNARWEAELRRSRTVATKSGLRKIQ